MRIQYKILIIAVVTFALFGFIFILNRGFEQKNIALILARENSALGHNLEKVVALKGRSLELLVADYSYWDEMVEFIEKKDPEWVKGNVDASFGTFAVEGIWIYSPDFERIHSVYAPGSEQVFSNIKLTPDILRSIFSAKRLCHFFIFTGSGLIEIRGASVHPSNDPSRLAEPKGYFIAGHVWSETVLKELSGILEARVNLSFNADPVDAVPSTREISASKTLTGWDGQPLAYLHAVAVPEFIPLFLAGSKQDIVFIFLTFFVLMIMLFFFILRMVDLPLKAISNALLKNDPRPLDSISGRGDEYGEISRILGLYMRQKEQISFDRAFRKSIDEALVIGIVVIDLRGKVTFVNPGFCALTGYSEKEIIGMEAPYPIWFKEDQQRLYGELRRFIDEGRTAGSLELRLRAKDGRAIEVISTMSVLKVDGRNSGYSATFQDITERRRIEDSLRQSNQLLIRTQNELKAGEERYRTLINNIAGAVYRCRADKQLTILFFSDEVEKISGYPASDFVNNSVRSFASVIHPEDAQRVELQVYEALRCRRPYELEYRIISKDKQDVWVLDKGKGLYDQDGRVIWQDGVVFDITGRKQLEAQQQRLKMNLEALWGLAKIQGGSPQELNDYVLRKIVELSKSKYAFYGLINDAQTEMTIFSWSSEVMRECCVHNEPLVYPLEKAGIWAEAVRRQCTKVVNDYCQDMPGKLGLPQGHVAITRFMSIPVLSHGKVVAVGAVANKETEYTGEDVEQLEAFLQNTQIILDHKQVESALRESQEKYMDLFENANDSIFTMDFQGNFTSFNRITAELLGYSTEEFSRLNLKEILTPKSYSLAVQMISEAVEKSSDLKHLQPWEFEMLKKSKESCFFSMRTRLIWKDGRMVGIHGIARDITARRKMEDSIKEREIKLIDMNERLREIIEFLPDATFVIDKERKLIAWNKACEELSGVKKEQILGKGDYAYAVPFYGSARPILIDSLFSQTDELPGGYANAGRKGNSIYGEAQCPATYGGKGARLWATASLLFDSKGEIAGAIESVRDISERENARQELENAYHQLQEAQQEIVQSGKMAAMGQLVAGVSHELNQPLTGIKGFAQASLLDLNDKKLLTSDLNKIIEQADRMARIISNLRIFSRKSAFQTHSLDINLPIEDAVMLLSQQLKVRNIRMGLRLTEGLPAVHGDSNQLQQVFLNLLTNARDAIETMKRPEGGDIVIETGFSNDKSSVDVTVQDNGCGISAENIEHIFNPFFTTKSPDGGMGLGLSIVYRILETHKAAIQIHSDPGKGTKVMMRFPAGADNQAV